MPANGFSSAWRGARLSIAIEPFRADDNPYLSAISVADGIGRITVAVEFQR
jgi:hypothetical protein